MRRAITLYFKAFALFLAFDSLWLVKFSPEFYRANIGHLMADLPNLYAALVFYILFIAGLIYFAIFPSLSAGSPKGSFTRGFFFGLVTYGTFDLTSQAVLRDWPTIVTVVDLCWGSFLCGVTTYVVTKIELRRLSATS